MNIINVGNRIMNTYIFPIKDGYVMIDTGYENSYQSCSSAMTKHGISWKDIKYIFLTHAHDDHAGFLKEVLDKHSNVVCIASNKAFEVLSKGQNSFNGGCSSKLALFFCCIMKLFGKGEHRFPAMDDSYKKRFIEITSDTVEDVEKLLNATILFTPGHTKDSISLKADNIVFCGDAAMNGIPSLHRITIWVENLQDFEKSWQRLLDSGAEYMYPAHGRRFQRTDLKKYKDKIGKVTLYSLRYGHKE